MKAPVWIEARDAIVLYERLLALFGGAAGRRDPGLLESALSRPRQRLAYAPESTVFELAAAYAAGLVGNHPFVDGNKRTAFVAMELFLDLNGWTLVADDADCIFTMEAVAAGQITEVDLAVWIRGHLAK